MIKSSLEIFVNTVQSPTPTITLADVRRLQRDIMPDGVESRDEADVLIALDRAVADKHGTWSAFADPGRWSISWSGPRGRPAMWTTTSLTWLVASLSAGRGPTQVAQAIAFEVVREAERSDEALVDVASCAPPPVASRALAPIAFEELAA